MIATTPVARWTWGRDDESADRLVPCLRDALAAYAVLASHRLAVGVPKVRLKVPESGNSKNLLSRANCCRGQGSLRRRQPRGSQTRCGGPCVSGRSVG